jgi:Flp pilus assembly protein TadG
LIKQLNEASEPRTMQEREFLSKAGIRPKSARHAAARRPAPGQVVVIVAILLPVLLGVTALGTDVAVFYYNWAHLQQAADAAVLAGAHSLPNDSTQAISTASHYVNLNGVANSEIVSTTVSADKKSLSMKLSRQVSYYFGHLVGFMSSPVVASATATLVTAGAVTGILPIAVQYNTNYTYGQVITLKQGGGPSPWGPGNWGPLALGGTGASNYSNNIQTGYTGVVSVGDTLATETGSMTGPTKQGFDARISAGLSEYPAGTFESHTLDDPRAVVVPMVDFTGVQGSVTVPVKGFAELWLVSSAGSGNITAYFITSVVPGVKPKPGGSDFGTYMPVLTK